jgi:hypothetical protein
LAGITLAALSLAVVAVSAASAQGDTSNAYRPTRICLAARFTVNAAAEVLDMEKSALVEGLRSGQSLAEIAEAQGMSAGDFKAALLGQARDSLDAKVAEGKLTQEKADKIYQAFEGHIDQIINFHPDPSRHPCRPRAHRAAGDSAAPASAGF